MMAVDASAILAVFLKEDGGAVYEAELARAGQGVISSVNYWEVLVRAGGERGAEGGDIVSRLLADLGVEIVPADAELAREAAQAFHRFRGRPGGRLNLGDCFAYALAAREGDGLLYKGNDFPKTDVKSALAR
jgi:ribonuclease VapC